MDRSQQKTDPHADDSRATQEGSPADDHSGFVFSCPGCQSEIREKVKYCPQCRFYLGDYLADEPAETPVQVIASLQDKIFKQDAAGVLCMKIMNQSGQPLKKIEANIECLFVDETFLKAAVKENLGENASTLFHLNMIPRHCGELVAKIFITYWKSDTEPNVLEGETILYTTGNDAPQPIHIGTIDRSMRLNGSEGYGIDGSGDINVNIESASGPQHTLIPEYLQEGAWRELPLKWSLESTKLLRESISPPPSPRPASEVSNDAVEAQEKKARGAWMRWEMPGREAKRVYVHFEPVVRLGRDASQDIICFHMTGQSDIDEQTYSISRRHLTLKVDVNTCTIEDHSTHTTIIDSYRLHNESVAVHNSQIINLAGQFPLKYRAYRDISPLQHKVRSAFYASRTIQQSGLRFSGFNNDRENLPINAIRLQKIGSGDNPMYFVLIKEIDMGSAEKNPLCLPCADVSELHAKLVLSKGRLRIVDQGTGYGTWVNGKKLARYDSKTLNTGDELRLGSATTVIRYVT